MMTEDFAIAHPPHIARPLVSIKYHSSLKINNIRKIVARVAAMKNKRKGIITK